MCNLSDVFVAPAFGEMARRLDVGRPPSVGLDVGSSLARALVGFAFVPVLGAGKIFI